MTIPQNQTLKLPDKYAGLGVTRGFKACPPEDLRMILEGEPGQGKTQFLMSIPDILVLDFDRAAENAISQRAYRVAVPDYTAYLGIKQMLLDDARAGRKFFRRVAFDTADGFILAKDRQMTDELNATREAKGGRILDSITSFGEQGAGYIKLAKAVLAEILELYQAGYPFILACHMKAKTITIGETRIVERRHVMPPTIMEALLPWADVKARFNRSMDTVIPNRKQQIPDGRGGTKVIEVPGNPTTLIRYWLGVMPTDPNEADNDTKRRIPNMSGIIEIPLVNGWDAFVRLYTAAATRAASEDSPQAQPATAAGTAI